MRDSFNHLIPPEVTAREPRHSCDSCCPIVVRRRRNSTTGFPVQAEPPVLASIGPVYGRAPGQIPYPRARARRTRASPARCSASSQARSRRESSRTVSACRKRIVTPLAPTTSSAHPAGVDNGAGASLSSPNIIVGEAGFDPLFASASHRLSFQADKPCRRAKTLRVSPLWWNRSTTWARCARVVRACLEICRRSAMPRD